VKYPYDGILTIGSIPVLYSILPDGRRIIIADESSKTHLVDFVKSDTPGAIRFQNTNGLVRTGIDVKMFPTAIASHIKKAQITDLEHYTPWIIFSGLFLLGSIALLASPGDDNCGVDFKGALSQLVHK
jgi:hypothetical protein